MKLEFDPTKSAANKAKHGIDFVEARGLWADPWVLEVPVKTEDEPRVMATGQTLGKHWVAIWTPRGAKVRIISVRRARKDEVDDYESGRI